MKLRLFLLVLNILFITNLFSQKIQRITQLYTLAPVSISNPYFVDSVNIKGERFTEKELLKTNISFPPQSSFVRPLKADTAGYIFPGNKPEKGSAFQLFSFNISANRYGKGTIKVISPNMLELYVDGKLAATKTTKEDNLRSEKSVTTSINPYPLVNRVVIKLLNSAEDKALPALNVSIEYEKNDTQTQFAISHTDKRLVNFTDVLLGNRVTKISISPQGNFALIAYKNTFGEKSQTTTQLYNLKTGLKALIDTDDTKKQLAWMPKSEKFYYVSKTEDGVRLITVNPLTLEEQILSTDIPDQKLIISPDERFLFYTKEEKAKDEKKDLVLLRSPEDRQSGYMDRTFIYSYDLNTGLSQQLTFGSHSTSINDISADGNQLLFSISDETLTERPFSKNSMYILHIPTMSISTVWEKEGFAYDARFSPDNKKILIIGAGEAFDGKGLNLEKGLIANSYNRLAYIMDLSTKDIEPISKNFNPSIDQYFWNSRDNLIYFITTDRDNVTVYSYDLSSKKYTRLPLNEQVIRTFSLAANNPNIAVYMGVSESNSTKAYMYDTKSQKSILLADPYGERLSQIELGKVEDWNFLNSDGEEISGRFYLPPNFDASKKYPMIVYYYAGTMPTSRTYEGPYPPHVFASQGYVVYVLQPSGAIGYGQKFAALHVNAWGKRTSEDIIEGTKKFIKEHNYVDNKKIGCIGASYGGFMTMYLQTQTDMFATAVSHAGISSLSSYWGEGYWGYTYSSGASAHSYPWNNPDLYVKQSPLFNADKIKTPILLTHGTADTNVPIGESIQMYTALKILGKPVEFIQVKDENHGVMNYKRRVEWNNSIMAWFSKWLKDDSAWWDSLYPN